MAVEQGHVMTDDEEQAMLPQPKRRDWQINQQKIAKAILTSVVDSQRQPTYAEISKITGLSEQAITRHMKELDFAALFQDQRERMASLAPNVMMAIYNSAMKGSAKSQEMMMQIIFGWASPKMYDPPTAGTELDEDEMQNIDRGIELLLAMKNGAPSQDGERPSQS